MFSGPRPGVFSELKYLGEGMAVIANLAPPFAVTLAEVSHGSASCSGKGVADCIKLEVRAGVTT